MITKEISQTVNGNITIVYITIHQDEYLDEKGAQEFVTQVKQYANSVLGGN